MLSLSPELSLIFATPLSLRTIPDVGSFNAGLERAILARHRAGTGARISNIGGWQSTADLLNWPEPEMKQLLMEIDHSIQQIWALPVFLKQRAAAEQKRGAYTATS